MRSLERGLWMEKSVHCNCKKGCTNRRCVCLKSNEPCDERCGCVDCRNPLNGLDVEGLTVCTLQNIESYKALTDEQLDEKYELPCGDQEVPLRELLGKFLCKKCHEEYWYSFCWDDVVQDSCSWHCEVCNRCRDWREWHCEKCNRCTYGVTTACEYCGNRDGVISL